MSTSTHLTFVISSRKNSLILFSSVRNKITKKNGEAKEGKVMA